MTITSQRGIHMDTRTTALPMRRWEVGYFDRVGLTHKRRFWRRGAAERFLVRMHRVSSGVWVNDRRKART